MEGKTDNPAPGPVATQPQQYGQQQYGFQGQQQTQYGMQPVQLPPGQVAIVAQAPAPIPGCPPGLEYLTTIDQVLVRQLIELVEIFLGWETNNKYTINNSMGQTIYNVKEETDCCMRQFCGPARGFTLHVTDNIGNEVMRIIRPFKCCAGCCWCATRDCDGCAFELQVEAPPGEIIGYVRQAQYCWTSEYIVMDAKKNDVFWTRGPCCPVQAICCTEDLDWNVHLMDKTTEVGKVSKQWAGMFREMISDADKFGVRFPMDLDVKMKATLIGLLFMIDFMFFEQKKNK